MLHALKHNLKAVVVPGDLLQSVHHVQQNLPALVLIGNREVLHVRVLSLVKVSYYVSARVGELLLDVHGPCAHNLVGSPVYHHDHFIVDRPVGEELVESALEVGFSRVPNHTEQGQDPQEPSLVVIFLEVPVQKLGGAHAQEETYLCYSKIFASIM